MDNRKKNILLGVLIVGVISMTVAFAALSTNLRINGTANVASLKWNIHFQEWKVDTNDIITVGSNTQHNTAVYPQVDELTMEDSTNVTKVSGINVTLKQPNDYAKYKFEIINEGTIDAKLDNFTHNINCESGKTCDFMEYEVKCFENSTREGTEITTNSTLAANGGTVYCYLQVKYKDVNNVSKTNTASKIAANVAGSNQVYEQGPVTADLTASWTWVQDDTNSSQSGSGEVVTPSNPYQTTFDGSYTAYKWYDVATDGYSDGGSNHSSEGWYTSLNPEAKAYLRTTGSLPEICGVFNSGTVCMTSSYYNSNYSSAGSYNSDFGETDPETGNYIVTGYAKAKMEEMEAAGASCSISSAYVYCGGDGGVGCHIFNEGYVSCYVGSANSVSVSDNGNAN